MIGIGRLGLSSESISDSVFTLRQHHLHNQKIFQATCVLLVAVRHGGDMSAFQSRLRMRDPLRIAEDGDVTDLNLASWNISLHASPVLRPEELYS